MAGFDLGKIDPVADSEAGAWVHFVDIRNGKPIYADGDVTKPVRVRQLGPLSKTAQDASLEVQKAQELREAERDVYEGDKLITKGESTAKEISADNAKMLAAVATGWENCAYNGKEKFSTALIEKFYAEVDWARNQSLAKFSNLENFIQGLENS